MSHTPGPWDVNGNAIETENFPLAFVVDERDIDIPATEVKANARLIAAAPELLEALVYATQTRRIECSSHPEGFDDICANCKIRAAIDKATGGDL